MEENNNYNEVQENSTESVQNNTETVQNIYSTEQGSANGQDKKGFAVASLVLGIISIVFGCCFWYVGIICAVIGLVLGIMANKESKSGLATAGIVLSIIALALGVLWIILLIAGVSIANYTDILNQYKY